MDPTPELMELLHHAHEWLRVPLLCSIKARQLCFTAALGWGHDNATLHGQLGDDPLSSEHPVLEHIITHGVCSFGTVRQLGIERWYEALSIEVSDQMFCVPIHDHGELTHLLIGDPRSKGGSIQETFELLEPLTDRIDAFDSTMEESSVYEISHAQEISEIYEDSIVEDDTSAPDPPTQETSTDDPVTSGERAPVDAIESATATDATISEGDEEDSSLDEDSLDYILEEISAPEDAPSHDAPSHDVQEPTDELEISATARALLDTLLVQDVRASMQAGEALDANLGVWRELAAMFPGRLVIDRFQYPLATLPSMRMHSGVLAACDRNLPAPPDVLSELLQSRNVDACFYACWLATHGAPGELVPALTVHLTQRDKQIVQMARAAIYRASIESEDPGAIAAQIALFRDAVTIERGKAAAMETLGMLGGQEHITELIGALADPSANIRRSAHMGLKRYSFVKLPEDRSRWLQWWRVNQNTPRWQLVMRAMADDSIEIRRLVHELLTAHPNYTGDYRPSAPAAALKRHQTQTRVWLEANIS